MALKFRAKTKEEIPTLLQSLYVERDGVFVLDVEGTVDGECVAAKERKERKNFNRSKQREQRSDVRGPTSE